MEGWLFRRVVEGGVVGVVNIGVRVVVECGEVPFCKHGLGVNAEFGEDSVVPLGVWVELVRLVVVVRTSCWLSCSIALGVVPVLPDETLTDVVVGIHRVGGAGASVVESVVE